MGKYIKTSFSGYISESLTTQDKIKNIIFGSLEVEGFIKALKVQYGELVPLYHATTLENSKIIDSEGLKLTFGKNFKHFGSQEQIYFQIGKSDYIDDHRCVLYRWDAPLDFLAQYACADMDSVNEIEDEELIKIGIDAENVCSEMRDFIKSFIYNGMKLEGMELIITNTDEDSDFPEIRPVKV